jgi:hypothetical protein
MVGFVWGVFGLTISIWGFLAGQAVSAVTHYWADRRFTLEWLAAMLGLAEFHDLGVPRHLEAQEYVLNSGQRVVRLFVKEYGSPPPIAWDNPSLGTGKYVLDQSWHWACLFFAAVATVLI